MSEITKLIVLLNNFNSDVGFLKMNNRTDLRRTSEKEMRKLMKSAISTFSPKGFFTPKVKYVIETRIREDEFSADHLEFERWKYIREIILALRLLHEGDVNAICSFWLEENKVTGFSYPERSQLFDENPYFLKREETKSFKRLWKAIQKIEGDIAYLTFPLEQFTKGFEKRAAGFDNEACVDYAIGLESLVFHKEERAIEPAGKVIGIAIGMLLGNNEKERIEIKNSLEKAYKIRNALVHGNLKEIHRYESELIKVSTEMENYLRNSLSLLIEE